MDEYFWVIVGIGFLAQLIDGALGMAYGLTATSLLLSLGFPPAIASATVHAAETVTTGISGGAHHLAGNVDWRLVARLGIAGCLGGVAGAWLLSSGYGEILKPFVSVYLALMGLLVIAKALRPPRPPVDLGRLAPLGAAGGFLDAIGGGGWGPIVSSTLMLSGHEPRRMIGSSATTEFFVTAAITATFTAQLGVEAYGMAAVALIVGGVPAAPLAAWLVKAAPRKALMIAVGGLVFGLGVYGLSMGL